MLLSQWYGCCHWWLLPRRTRARNAWTWSCLSLLLPHTVTDSLLYWYKPMCVEIRLLRFYAPTGGIPCIYPDVKTQFTHLTCWAHHLLWGAGIPGGDQRRIKARPPRSFQHRWWHHLSSGHDTKKHDANLEELLKKSQDKNVTFTQCNKAKCNFNKNRVVYYGFMFSKDGEFPDSSKVQAIKSVRPPRNAAELNQVLCTVRYSSRFVGATKY